MLATWSLRVFAATTGTWLILGTIYFARPSQPLLPSPLNVLLFVLLATVSAGALTSWFTAKILAALADLRDVLGLMAQRMDARDNRLNTHLLHIGRRLDDLEGPTMQMERRLVAVGTATVPPTPADVIELGQRLVRKLKDG